MVLTYFSVMLGIATCVLTSPPFPTFPREGGRGKIYTRYGQLDPPRHTSGCCARLVIPPHWPSQLRYAVRRAQHLGQLEFPGRGDHAQHIADPLFGGIAWLVCLEMQLPVSGRKCDQGSTGIVVHRNGTHKV